MAIINLGENNSVANDFLSQLRDKQIQRDRSKFRKNVERLGEVMAYEISKTLAYENRTVATPMGNSSMSLIKAQPVLISVLRAALPYFNGFANFFDQSDCGFIGAYRDESKDQLVINLEYVARPSITGRVVLLIDPMLATGRSFLKAVESILKKGNPSHLHVAALIAAPEGIRYLEQHMPLPFTLWTFAIDERLNEQFYIVPGLGDAGDLSYGDKI